MTEGPETRTSRGAGLERLNALPAARAEVELLACCGSTAWARRMAAVRPFTSLEQLHAEAERTWWSLHPSDWLEAFGAHPRIGERTREVAEAPEPPDGGATRRGAAWSEEEQAAARDVRRETRERLAEANREYEDRFGHVFLICATGRSADEMLAALEDRMGNEPHQELRVAATEQSRIIRLRLEKLLRP